MPSWVGSIAKTTRQTGGSSGGMYRTQPLASGRTEASRTSPNAVLRRNGERARCVESSYAKDRVPVFENRFHVDRAEAAHHVFHRMVVHHRELPKVFVSGLFGLDIRARSDF